MVADSTSGTRHRHLWRRLALCFALLVAGAASAGIRGPAPAVAESEITVVSSEASVQFPSAVTFIVVASSPATITSVGLELNTPGKSYGAIPLDVHPTFTPSGAVRAVWTWDSPGPGFRLPPGVDIAYQWALKDANGGVTQTPWQTVRYADSRYAWQEKSEPGVRLYWYQGGDAFGSRLMQAAQSGLEKLRQDQGIDLKSDIVIYVYADQRALRGAMLGSPTWIGGRAYPEFGTILLIIGQGGLAEGERALVHELTHQLVYQQTFDPLLGSHVPLWLNEGLAVTSEGPTAPQLKSALSAAVRESRVPSFRNLDGAFPSDEKASTLAYAQSESFVRYLLAQYGAGGMRSLLSALQRGNRIDASLSQSYGADLDRLQDSWRLSVGATPLSSSAPAGATVAPDARPATSSRFTVSALPLLAGFAVFSVLLLVVMALFIRWMRSATPQQR